MVQLATKEYFGGFHCEVTSDLQWLTASVCSHYCRCVEHKYGNVNLNCGCDMVYCSFTIFNKPSSVFLISENEHVFQEWVSNSIIATM